MQPKTPFDYTILSVKVLLGVWFVLLGLEKIFRVGVGAFQRQVAEFRILMDPWNLPVAYLVVWTEVIAGLCLLAGWLNRGAARVLAGLTLLFIFVTVQAMVLGFEPDCGCFGKLMILSPPAKLVLLVVQLSALIFLITTEGYDKKRVFGGSRMKLST